MRYVTAFSIVAHAAIAFVAWFDPFSPKELLAPTPPALLFTGPAPEIVPADTLSVADLEVVDREITRLIFALQQDTANVDVMVELARLYAEQGWFEQAIGPLARAAELQPERAEIAIELGIVLGRAGYSRPDDVDLAQRAKGFVESVTMHGHGC